MIKRTLLTLCSVVCSTPLLAAPANFLFLSSGDLPDARKLLARDDIQGAQVVYNWKQLEPELGQYDFTSIEHDLALLSGMHRKLFIQIQDRFFTPEARSVPDYLLHEPIYKGGLVAQVDNPGEGKPKAQGWVAQQWNPAVQKRYQALLAALGKRFDRRVYGINLPETAIDIDMKNDRTGFSCNRYFNAEVQNMRAARVAFKHTKVVQYVNFWPCEWNNDHKYMQRVFAFAANNDIGLGGPDVVPGKKAHMNNAYPFFNRYKKRLPLVAMAIQEPTLTYVDPKTGKPFTREAMTRFAVDYLGASILFWSPQSPWLKTN
jgi:hypothetical protein